MIDNNIIDTNITTCNTKGSGLSILIIVIIVIYTLYINIFETLEHFVFCVGECPCSFFLQIEHLIHPIEIY